MPYFLWIFGRIWKLDCIYGMIRLLFLEILLEWSIYG